MSCCENSFTIGSNSHCSQHLCVDFLYHMIFLDFLVLSCISSHEKAVDPSHCHHMLDAADIVFLTSRNKTNFSFSFNSFSSCLMAFNQ